MEDIISIVKYETDSENSWGMGQETQPISKTFDEVLKYAIGIKAQLIVRPSLGKYWYIKGINNKKTMEEIKEHIETNLANGYKKKSRCWLITY
jgi:hypothetical protein